MIDTTSNGHTWSSRVKIPPSLSQTERFTTSDVYHDITVSRQPDPSNPGVTIYSVTMTDCTKEVDMRRRETALLKEILPGHVLQVLLEEKAERERASN